MNKLENQSILPTNGNKLKSAVLATALALGLVILPGVSNGTSLIKSSDSKLNSNDWLKSAACQKSPAWLYKTVVVENTKCQFPNPYPPKEGDIIDPSPLPPGKPDIIKPSPLPPTRHDSRYLLPL